uniref:Os01g0778700 protein n=1 Tax=Macrostomum lignano TaxID=282301 RepID=A0A1I8FT99_9PLAT
FQLSWVEIIGQGQEASRGFDKTLSKSQTSFILSNLKLGRNLQSHAGSHRRLRLPERVALKERHNLCNHSAPAATHDAADKTAATAAASSRSKCSVDRRLDELGAAARLQQQLGRADHPAHELDCSCHSRPASPLLINSPFYEAGSLNLLLIWPSADA